MRRPHGTESGGLCAVPPPAAAVGAIATSQAPAREAQLTSRMGIVGSMAAAPSPAISAGARPSTSPEPSPRSAKRPPEPAAPLPSMLRLYGVVFDLRTKQ